VVLNLAALCVSGAGVTSEARVAELIFFLEDYSGVVKDQVGVPQHSRPHKIAYVSHEWRLLDCLEVDLHTL
jgi:hypothetical protein